MRKFILTSLIITIFLSVTNLAQTNESDFISDRVGNSVQSAIILQTEYVEPPGSFLRNSLTQARTGSTAKAPNVETANEPILFEPQNATEITTK